MCPYIILIYSPKLCTFFKKESVMFGKVNLESCPCSKRIEQQNLFIIIFEISKTVINDPFLLMKSFCFFSLGYQCEN